MTKAELNEAIREDKAYYYSTGLKRLYRFLTHNPLYQRGRYVICCRKAGFYMLHRETVSRKLLALYYCRKKNILGEKVQIELGPYEFGRRIKLYHSGIVVNVSARIGDDCELYGSTYIGNRGSGSNNTAPILGSRVSVGTGSIVIGDIRIADGVQVSAASFVNKDLDQENSLYAGTPAVWIRER